MRRSLLALVPLFARIVFAGIMFAGIISVGTGSAIVSARAQPQKAPAKKKAAAEAQQPLHFYLAKGGTDACGPGCSEWIAVEGSFDRAAPARLQAFLKRIGTRKLPLFFHSPGGDGNAAMVIGRELRARGLTTGVARTMPRACASPGERSPACQAAKRSQQPVEADWRPDGQCFSACVFALIGGRERLIPPSARLGVHSARYTFVVIRRWSDGRVQHLTEKQLPAMHKSGLSEANARLRRYIVEMGIDAELFAVADRIPHEDILLLSRDQIGSFAIDRREFVETSWIVQPTRDASMYVVKWLVQARGADRREFRTSLVSLSCSEADRAMIVYVRGLAADEVRKFDATTLSIGKQQVKLFPSGTPRNQQSIEPGVLFMSSVAYVALERLSEAVGAGEIEIAEAEAGSTTPPTIRLATQGLAEGLDALRARCNMK